MFQYLSFPLGGMPRRKPGRAVLAAVTAAMLAFPVHAETDPANYDLTRMALENAAPAYGFVLAQERTLQRIADQYPDLVERVAIVQMGFDAAMGDPENIYLDLAHTLASPDEVRKMTEQYQARLAEIFTGEISRPEAEAFLNEVVARTSWQQIPSPMLEGFLWLKYGPSPADEMLDGHVQTFSTAGHAKSLGLEVQMRLPRSWEAAEGERPHILKKWISQNGTGKIIAMFLVRDAAPTVELTRQDVEEVVISGDYSGILPDSARGFDAARVVLDGKEALRLDYTVEAERLDAIYQSYVRSYMTIVDGRFVSLQCQTNRGETDETRRLAHLALIPLCDLIANSIVFPAQY